MVKIGVALIDGAKIGRFNSNGKDAMAIAGVIGCLAVMVFLINGSALAGNWRWDDPSILLHLHQYSIFQDFINPEIWRQFSPANLTPWLIFSYELDLTLFGLNPTAFYLHQLLALLAVALAFYFVLRLWVGSMSALAGAALFVLGAPGVTVAQQLMTRHYLEGLLFCLLALILFVYYIRSKQRIALVASVFFYLLSITAKETYVPLVLLLPFLPEGSISQRIKASMPYIAVVVLYTFWRFYMLGTATGGYVDSSDYLTFTFIARVLASFSQLPALMFGSLWPLLVMLYGVLFLIYAYTCGSARLLFLSLFLLVSFLTLLPLVPLVSSPGINLADRYLLLPWLVLCFSVAFFADRLVGHFSAGEKLLRVPGLGVGLVVIMAITLGGALAVQKTVLIIATEYDVQADFILNNDSSRAFVPSANVLPALWYVTDLVELKNRLTAQSAPHAVIDQIYRRDNLNGLVAYNADCQCMQDTTLPTSPRQDEAPLYLQFNYQDRYFTWQFGPYDSGVYQVVSPDFGVIPVPPGGRIRVTLAEGDVFYLRYTSTEGWTTYSDQQTINPGAGDVRWQRE